MFDLRDTDPARQMIGLHSLTVFGILSQCSVMSLDYFDLS